MLWREKRTAVGITKLVLARPKSLARSSPNSLLGVHSGHRFKQDLRLLFPDEVPAKMMFWNSASVSDPALERVVDVMIDHHLVAQA